MANRFLESNFYKSPFVRGLKGPLKSLYSFIICDCSPSGIWAKDLEAAGMYIGFPISEEDFLVNFVENGKAISIGRGKYFFPDFIEHQYPSGLSTNNKSHTKTIEELKNLGLLDQEKTTTQKDKKNQPFNTYFALSNKGASKPLSSPHGNGNGNGNGNGISNSGKFSEFNLILTDTLKQSCLEILSRAQFGTDKQVTIEHVENFFILFYETYKDSNEVYENEDKVWLHFKRWLPKQKINGRQQKSIIDKNSAGFDYLLQKGTRAFAKARGGHS